MSCSYPIYKIFDRRQGLVFSMLDIYSSVYFSNQRAELTNDQQMNYLLAWFNNWSDLQKEDFIPVLAEKLSSKWAAVNGVSDSLSSLTLDNNRPPSLFQCQVKKIMASFPLFPSTSSDSEQKPCLK